MATTTRGEARPLGTRFPGLAVLPRAELGRYPTPIERARGLAPALWVKRDDLTGEPLGGNKVRALEFLLGRVRRGDRVVTVGALGSTHALATSIYARQLGAEPMVVRWPQEMTKLARAVAEWTDRTAARSYRTRTVAGAYARASWLRLRGAHWIPAGGSTPLGILGHVEAALELAAQIENGAMPMPTRIVLPLGSGGTTAGILLGTEIAGLPVRIVGARVVPRIVANRAHVLRLARRTASLIERLSGAPVPSPDPRRLEIMHAAYGGAYGRETSEGREAASRFEAWAGNPLDATYGAKGLAAALSLRDGGPTLFWLTFDGRKF